MARRAYCRVSLGDWQYEKYTPILGPFGDVYYFRMHVFQVPKTVRPNPDPFWDHLAAHTTSGCTVLRSPKRVRPNPDPFWDHLAAYTTSGCTFFGSPKRDVRMSKTRTHNTHLPYKLFWAPLHNRPFGQSVDTFFEQGVV